MMKNTKWKEILLQWNSKMWCMAMQSNEEAKERKKERVKILGKKNTLVPLQLF